MPIEIPNSLGELLSLEQRLLASVLAISQSPERQIQVSAEAADDRRIRGTFLRWYLIAVIPTVTPSPTSVEISGAEISGQLNLGGLDTKILLRFIGCVFNDPIFLSDATIGGFEMLNGQAGEITGDRLVVNGSMKFCPRDLQSSIRPKISKLRINGATIHGNLDMRACMLEPAQETTRETIALFADGLIVKGNLLLSDSFSASGEIRLNGSSIDRNLDCSLAHLQNPGGYSLSAAGAHIKGTAYFTEKQPWNINTQHARFASKGAIRLEGASIDGDLDCTGGEFLATAFLPERIKTDAKPPLKDLNAILADGLRVGGDAKLCGGNNPFSSHGIVKLISADIGGDFDCDNAVFDFPGEEPLVADSVTVSGVTFLDGIAANGVLRFVQANLKQGLYLKNASFDPSGPYRSWSKDASKTSEPSEPICGIDAAYAEIGGKFLWENVVKTKPSNSSATTFWMKMTGTKISTLVDDRPSWEQLDRLDLTNCEYKAISKLSDDELSWRLAALDREYAPSELLRKHADQARMRFKPQPYLHLAHLFRAAGYESAAKTVLVRLERNKTRYGDIARLRRVGRWMLDAFLRYGYSPFRPVYILGAWAIICTCLFHSAYNAGRFIQAKDNYLAEPTKENPKPPPRVVFRAPVYAVDTLVPIVDLHQKKNWLLKTPNWCLETLLIFNTFFGWLMTTLFAAGVTGLLRRDS